MTIIRHVVTTPRRREFISKAVQTEMTCSPDCASVDASMEKYVSEQFQDLLKLRTAIEGAMKEVACSVYDVNSFKDVLFKLEGKLSTELPMTDLLLLTSKLFRRTMNLGRLLGCFFGVIFADGHADERFHITELRILHRELTDLKERYKKAVEERTQLQNMLDEAGEVAVNHSRTVELLETQNNVLKLQTIGLEDQMALLFSQMNKDMQRQCREAYGKSFAEVDQDQLNISKEVFRQSMDTLSDQLRLSRTLIAEVRELVMACSQGSSAGGRTADQRIAKEPGIRFKLKQVESNFQYIVARFSAVKDVVSDTSNSLINALHERKNILFLALQHIRLYDIQNAKMRRSKANLTEMKRLVRDLQKRMPATFPPGTVTMVDRIGQISVQKWNVGSTLETIRAQRGVESVAERGVSVSVARDEVGSEQAHRSMKAPPTLELPSQKQTVPQPVSTAQAADYAAEEFSNYEPQSNSSYISGPSDTAGFPSVYSILDTVSFLGRQMDELDNNLMFENEVDTFLKILTLSIPTTPRAADELYSTLDEETNLGLALLPAGIHGRRDQQGGALGLTMSNTSDREGLPPPGLSTTALEGSSEIPRAHEKPTDGATTEAGKTDGKKSADSAMAEFTTKLGFLRQAYESRIADLERREADIHRMLTLPKTKEKQENAGENTPKRGTSGRSGQRSARRKGSANKEERKQQEDMDQLLQARAKWQQSKADLQGNKAVRETVIKELGKMTQAFSGGDVTGSEGRSELSTTTRLDTGHKSEDK
uniref:Uncharacterized protein TCIL3000_11_14740 n=1 Tax=Trypanosoma congolense (strain IL3000) TaxID=1068625 RepID=G0V2T5_TRYCI|nr:unnamed protein product [Trypanosoma congolense IL3000]